MDLNSVTDNDMRLSKCQGAFDHIGKHHSFYFSCVEVAELWLC